MAREANPDSVPANCSVHQIAGLRCGPPGKDPDRHPEPAANEALEYVIEVPGKRAANTNMSSKETVLAVLGRVVDQLVVAGQFVSLKPGRA